METIGQHLDIEKNPAFKSYYVVWKPQRKAGRMGFF